MLKYLAIIVVVIASFFVTLSFLNAADAKTYDVWVLLDGEDPITFGDITSDKCEEVKEAISSQVSNPTALKCEKWTVTREDA